MLTQNNWVVQEPEMPDVVALPHSREAEEAAVGCVLINPDTYYDLAAFLRADDFYIHRLRFVWEAFVRMFQHKVPVDILTICKELDDMGRLEEIGGNAYLTALLNQVPTTLHVTSYGEIVKSCSTRRRLLLAANNIAEAAYDQERPIEKVVTDAEQAVLGVAERMICGREHTAHDVAGILMDHVETMSRNQCPPGILTGHKDYDALTGGLRPGTSFLIGARPGVGKTALIATWIHNIMTRKNAERPFTVLNLMEGTPLRFSQRLAAMVAEIDAEVIRDGKLTDEQWPLFNYAIEVISEWPLVFIDERDPFALYAKINHMHAKGECDLLFNDYIGMFEVKAENRVREVGKASKEVTKIASRIGIPVTTTAQVSRETDTRESKDLVLKDLKESGDLEQDADGVLFINQDKMSNVRNLHLAKQRDGKVGRFSLIFRANFCKFENACTRNIDMENHWTDKD